MITTFSKEEMQDLADKTRLYARSKGLALMGQGVAFTGGALPLLYTAREAGSLPRPESAGLYAASAAFFLFAVWVGLKLVPDAVDRAYYTKMGDVRAVEPETPAWARFLAPLFLLAPIGAAGMGGADAWQATVIALALFGLYMFTMGRFGLHEPATEMIGAMTVMLAGLVAAFPGLAVTPNVGQAPGWLQSVLQAQGASLGITAWLGVAWSLAAVALHAYNRWLLTELGRKSGANLGQ